MRMEPAFAGVFRAELRFNATRALPYVLVTVFALNALLWWGWGPAHARGVATNSEGFITGVLAVFSFMTAPFFTALIMADPVLRDFEIGMDPLIFSKPIARARYIAAKFLGNYFVLALCQAAFIGMLIALQLFRKTGMVVEPFTIIPYLRHFFVIVGISHFALAAVFFAVATVTRSAMAAYGAAMAGYFAYFGWQMALRNISPAWRVAMDPLLMNSFSQGGPRFLSGSVSYSALEIGNRVVMVVIAVLALVVVQMVFSRRALYPGRAASASGLRALELPIPDSSATRGHHAACGHAAARRHEAAPSAVDAGDVRSFRAVPELAGVLAAEGRLFMADRVLQFAIPLVLLLSVTATAVYRPVLDGTLSGGYAARTTDALAPMLVVLVFFCAGLVVHRDRIMRMEGLVMSTPVTARAIIAARFIVLNAACSATAGVSIAATVLLQALRERDAVAVLPYVASFGLILIPAIFFLSALSLAGAQIVREKHAYHAVMVATAGATYYLYLHGHVTWWYNPIHYGIWRYAGVMNATSRYAYMLHAAYWMILGLICLFLATRSFSSRRHGATR